MVARRKASGPFHRQPIGLLPGKAFQRNAQPAPPRSCLGDWGPPQQAILQSKMQSVYHSALLASFVSIHNTYFFSSAITEPHR